MAYKFIDYTKEIDNIPKRPKYTILPSRSEEKYITIHYSGVNYTPSDDGTDLKRILSEARYHVGKDWGNGNGVYGDGYMYDYVVLSSGTVVKTRSKRQRLWHCGNITGNNYSWSLHVLSGSGQDLTENQVDSIYQLIDSIRAEYGIERGGVVGHCEWPRSKGSPIISSTYKLLPGQSECPGSIIMNYVYRYRAGVALGVVRKYTTTRPMLVMTGRSYNSDIAVIDGRQVIVPINSTIDSDNESDGWVHMSSGLGFINIEGLKEIGR